jgi:RNA polymerase sigma-70 factor (ECF subfamily)
MQRYQAGEGEALEALVREVSPRLRAIFRGSASADEVEELVQETWFQVHRSRHTWRPGELLLPWIYSIARHVRARSYHKRTRRAEVELDERLYVPAPKLSLGMDQLLRELPESQREVLILMKVEGRSLDEVAAATGTTVGSVKQKVHRAYEKLRKILGGEL